MTRAFTVGLDMGGTNIRCAAVSVDGEVLLMNRGPAHASRAAIAVAVNIGDQLIALLESARLRGLGSPKAIGVAVPGPLDVYSGIVRAAPHVAAWHGFPLRRMLEARIGRRVIVENDANAWALGEFWRGAARGRSDVVLLTLGTGVGGGLIVGGKLVHGRSGMAGELGHITVNPDGPPCDCGSHGCLESYASASGLRGLLVHRLDLSPDAPLPENIVDDGGNFSVRRMSALARAGDALSLELFAIAGSYLGIAVASLLNAFNPELVVIGGGVAGALPYMRNAMNAQIKVRAFAAIASQAKIVRAALGPASGVVGAAYAALHPPERK
ncbi:MAG: ROK family protein [Candidatus Binatus sp.]|uniref:ROK family protein n=1 Tax=Candidatus Binatus sp. TaxID=2811406 RepID=UPI00272592FB|nr:ROK family protein [Candidatus Binatus sp.]MDO8432900.1 ROK family protein [Candidatus Binatus sp.]